VTYGRELRQDSLHRASEVLRLGRLRDGFLMVCEIGGCPMLISYGQVSDRRVGFFGLNEKDQCYIFFMHMVASSDPKLSENSPYGRDEAPCPFFFSVVCVSLKSLYMILLSLFPT